MTRAAFTDFAPPAERLLLGNQALQLELWPDLGGAVAAFAWRSPGGERVPLFRDAGVHERYTPIDHLACWPLVPYSNRIRAGCFTHHGREHRLPVNYAGFLQPLHGLGWIRPWRVQDSRAEHCTLELVHQADEHWPYGFTAQQHFALRGLALHSTLSVRNDSPESMPCGLGQHPYVSCPAGTRIRAAVRGVWLTDRDTLPREYRALPMEWNLRVGCLLDEVNLDNCFDGLEGAIEVQWPGGGSLVIEGSPNLGFLLVYHPLGGDFVCIELVSHLPDAFNQRGPADVTGLTALEPGATLQVSHRYSYRPP